MTVPTPRKPTLRPKDAASLIVIDLAGGVPRVLLGRRHPRQAFVPDKYVFPGGRVETHDKRVAIADGAGLAEADVARLLHDMKGKASAARAHGLAVAALRETFEETGYLLACQSGDCGAASVGDPGIAPPAWHEVVGGRGGPLLQDVRFVARAITPPARTRRYDTRFFLALLDGAPERFGDGDGEFTEIAWATYEEAGLLDLHVMTRTVLDDVFERIGAGTQAETAPVPYYFSRNGQFRRELIDVTA